MVKITKVGNRKIRVIATKVSEIKTLKKFTRIYNPMLKFSKAGKNRDSDCKTSILYRNEAWYGELDFIIKNLENFKIPYKVYFKQEKKIDKKKFIKYIKTIKVSFPPRAYQLQAVYDTLRYHYVSAEAVTGAGKSFISSVLSKMFIDKGYKVLVVVTKKNLVEQLYDNMIEYFGESISEYVQKIDSDYADKMFRKNIIISTWNTLQNKADESFLLFDAVIADECDCMSSYNSKYRQIVQNCENAKYVLGMTGTMPKDHVINYHNIVGVLGKHIIYINETEAEKAGIISKIVIKAMKLYHPVETYPEYIKHMEDNSIKIGDVVETRNKKWFELFMEDDPYDKEVCDKKFTITGTKGMTKFYSGDTLLDQKWFKTKIQFQREIEFIAKLEYRLEFLANFINTLEGNVLILTSFRDVEANKYLDYFSEKVNKNIQYIHGGVNTEDRNEIFKTIESTNDNLLLAISSTVGRGTSINNLQHFVMLSSIKKAESVRQLIGRMIRLDGKKNIAYVYDIADCIYSVEDKKFSNSMRHFVERKETYLERKFTFSEEKIRLKIKE